MITVLVVDDDFMVASVHTRFVQRVEGFEVVGAARNGAEALHLVAELDPDLVLLDVHLPDMSGLDVLARLRADGNHVGVVMVTAERGADAVRAALHGGAMQYLVKPFEHADLVARLQQVATVIRSLREEADGEKGIDQSAIDQAFGTGPGELVTATGKRLPKGLSGESGVLIEGLLREVDDVSAAEAGERLGMSRVSARRYLEHFVTTGRAEVRLRYGTAGRPERRYRRSGA
ncbi:response regulator [Nocardioides marmoraquaticus]